MYDYCRRNVPVERAAAITAVLALDQRLGDNSPALRARLGSSSRINRHDLTTSICSFVGDHRSQLRPRGVVHMLRQHTTGEALDVQIFNRDAAETVDQIAGEFVQHVTTARRDVRLMLGESDPTFAPRLRPSLAAGEGALQTAQSRGVALGNVWASNHLAVAQRDERCEAHVDADALGAGTLGSRDFDVKDHVPPARIARQDCALGAARQIAVPAHLDLTRDADKAELTALADCQAVTNTEVGSVIPVARTEAREASFLTTFDAAEESGERLVELTHHLLFGRRGPASDVRQIASDHGQARDLLVRADRDAFLVSSDAVFEGGVVKLAEVGKHLRQKRGLRPIRLNAEFVAQQHGSTALLVLDIPANRRFGDVTNGARKVGARPQRRQTRTQVRKLLAQEAGCRSLEAIDNLGHGARRVSLDKQVNVVRHNFDFVNEKTVLGGDLVKEGLEALINGRNENWTSVLRAPDDVILEAENSPRITCIPRSLCRHVLLYIRRITKRQHKQKERAALPLSAKAEQSPRRENLWTE